jgi:hypothetical protein
MTMERVELTIEGMSCEHCVRACERKAGANGRRESQRRAGGLGHD